MELRILDDDELPRFRAYNAHRTEARKSIFSLLVATK